MNERHDADIWSGLERRLSGIEPFIPDAAPWHPSTAAELTVKVRLGPVWRPSSEIRGRRSPLVLAFAVIALLIALVVGVALVASLLPGPEPDARFGPLGLLRQSDSSANAALLPDGRTLIVSGDWVGIGIAAARADIWDPASGLESIDPPVVARVNPVVTLLLDGRVLVTGGYGGPYQYSSSALASAELWDPATATFHETDSMASPRIGHTATVLSDGRVLIVGGLGPGDGQAEAEIWDPATELFGPAGTLMNPRAGHAATLLQDGRVLIVSGSHPTEGTGIGARETWDPSSGTFGKAGSFIDHARSVSLIRLPSGRVLIPGAFIATGGFCGVGEWGSTASDPRPLALTTMSRQRDGHAATLLADGRVLITGGRSAPGGSDLASAEIWDPADRAFHETKPLQRSAANHTAVLLADGRVLIVLDGTGPDGVVEPFIYEPEEIR